MGGGLATGALAAAVTNAGGLGTIGLLPPDSLRSELEAARAMTGGPLAINLIVPLSRAEHWHVAALADVVVTHWDLKPRRRTPGYWIQTVGTCEAARAAVTAGADAVIVQGVESGGHVIGTTPALELLEHVMRGLPKGFPVRGGRRYRHCSTTCRRRWQPERSRPWPAPASWPRRRAALIPITSSGSSTVTTPS